MSISNGKFAHKPSHAFAVAKTIESLEQIACRAGTRLIQSQQQDRKERIRSREGSYKESVDFTL
jgi:hypothetical protein